MKPTWKTVKLDVYETGAVIQALNDMRNKYITEGKPTDVMDGVLLKVVHARDKEARGRNEAR